MACMSTLTRGGLKITVVPVVGSDPTRIHVSDGLAAAADPQLAALIAEETALRMDPDADDLRDRLNAQINPRIADGKVEIARRVLELLRGVVEVSGELTFDRYAGCRLCPCTPGVVAPRLRRRGGGRVYLSVEAV